MEKHGTSFGALIAFFLVLSHLDGICPCKEAWSMRALGVISSKRGDGEVGGFRIKERLRPGVFPPRLTAESVWWPFVHMGGTWIHMGRHGLNGISGELVLSCEGGS